MDVRGCVKKEVPDFVEDALTVNVIGVIRDIVEVGKCALSKEVPARYVELDAWTCQTVGGEPTPDGYCRIDKN